MKRLLLILCALIIVSLGAQCLSETQIEVVTFGHYEQDNDPDNGPEPIEWIVVNRFGNHALLLSRNCLDARDFNDVYKSAPWETCTLRGWLNGSFFDAAFSEEEQSLIFDTTCYNTRADGYPAFSSDGKATTDKVFLLSYQELAGYGDRITFPGVTDYALSMSQAASTWWLRSPGPDDHAALVLYASGELNVLPVDNRVGIRPAITVNIGD